MTVPIQLPDFSRFEFWMAILQGLGPVLTWRLRWSVRRTPLAGGTEGY